MRFLETNGPSDHSLSKRGLKNDLNWCKGILLKVWRDYAIPVWPLPYLDIHLGNTRLRKARGREVLIVLQQWFFISQVQKLKKMGVPDGDAEKGKKVRHRIIDLN